jgi:hypothetical protein
VCERSRLVAVIFLASMLLATQAVYALPAGVSPLATTTTTSTFTLSESSTGSPSNPCAVTKATSGPCLVTPNKTVINFTAGIIEENGLKVLVPYIPLLPIVIPGGFAQFAPVALPTFPKPSNTCSVDFFDPLSWGNIFDCIGKYVGAAIAWLPVYIYAVVDNAIIGVVNHISQQATKISDEAWEVFAEAVNLPIAAFDLFTTGTGAALLAAVLWLPEPWSAFLTPFVWLFVFVVIFLIAAAAVWVGMKAAKGAEDVAELGVDLS